MKKKIVKLSSLALVSGLLASATVYPTAFAQGDETIATIGEHTVTQEDFYNTMKESYGETTLRTIILEKVLEMNASDAETLKKSAEDEVNQQKEEIGEDTFDQYLAYQNLGTSENYTHQVYVRNLLQDVIEQHIDLSDEAVNSFYEDGYKPAMEAQHILVEDEEEAKDLIKRINDGEEFDALAKEFSKDSSAENGGLLQPFTEGQMVPEFEEAVKGQANGEVTQEPVKSQYGYHIIKTINNGEKKPLEEVKDDVANQYKAQKIQNTEFVYGVIGQLISDAGLDIKDQDLKGAVQDLIDAAQQKDETSKESEEAPEEAPAEEEAESETSEEAPAEEETEESAQ